MKIGTLYAVNTVIAGVFGLSFSLAPAQTLAPYGVELPLAGLIVARLFGAALVGFAIVSWYMRSAEAATQRNVAVAYALSDALGTVFAAWGVVTGATNALGWSTVLIYALLGAAYGMQLLAKPAGAPAT